jgi:hypothetical protein
LITGITDLLIKKVNETKLWNSVSATVLYEIDRSHFVRISRILQKGGNMATAETKQQVTLELSEEQRSAIEALFAYNNWDLIVLSEKKNNSWPYCTSSSRMECDTCVGQTAVDEDGDGQGDGGDGSYSDQELGEGQMSVLSV